MNAVPHKEAGRKVGLARALSKLGYCSRSQASKFIRAGAVRLNGKVKRDPEAPVHLEHDTIAVDGRTIGAEHKVYFIMNKPRGFVTTAADEKNRATVYDVLKASGRSLPWVAPVGRLDKASEGLLILTNDSEWGARIADPDTHLEKTYHVQIRALADDALTQSMMHGVRTKAGDFLRVAHSRLLRTGAKNCWLEVKLDEGKNRQIRRVLEGLGIEVLRLVRVAIGPLELGKLAKGGVRSLTEEDKLALDRAIQRSKLATTKETK